MGLFAEVFMKLSRKYTENENKTKFIFYKIVGSSADGSYTLQCINTASIFHADISEIVFDIDILYSLHPIQACYIGLEYAKYLKRSMPNPKIKKSLLQKMENYAVNRYGMYALQYQDRKGNLCFRKKNTDEEYLMEPRDIALSKELVQEFDAAQAFYIGLMAGHKMEAPMVKIKKGKKHSHLQVVK